MPGKSLSEEVGQTDDVEVSASLLLKRESFPNAKSRSNLAEGNWATSVRQRLLCDTWFYELVAISISVTCLIAIGVVLSQFDQQSAPQFKYGLTLNAIVSILATGCKAGLIFSVASCISQLKWYWVQQNHRPLRDLQTFDDASRGFSGSIILLATFWARSLASIGAIITVLAVAFDPFVQQLLAYPVRTVPRASQAARIKQAAIFEVSGDYDTIENSFTSAINAGIWADSSQFARNPICTTGNCTWPLFKSVGWCSKCEDVTSSVSISGCNFTTAKTSTRHNHARNHTWYNERRKIPCKLSLDKGRHMDLSSWGSVAWYRSPTYTVFDTSVPTDAIWAVHGITTEEVPFKAKSVVENVTFNGVENPLSVFAHTSLKLLEERDPSKGLMVARGEQCVLSMCERKYNVTVSSGISSAIALSTNWGKIGFWDLRLNESIPGSYVYQVESPKGGDLVEIYWTAKPEGMRNKSLTWNSGAFIYTNPAQSAFTFGGLWYQSIASRIQGSASAGWILNGEVVANDTNVISNTGWGRDGSSIKYSSDAVEAISTKGLSAVVDSIAASLTRLGLDQSNVTLSGSVGMSEVYIHVRWKWLALPCLLEVAGVGFLTVTIIANRQRKVKVWKSSVDVLLYHGLEREVLHQHPIENTVSGMQQTSQLLTVRLTIPDGGGRSALRRQSRTVVN